MRWTVHGERFIYESDWMSLALTDVEIPVANRVGEENKGWAAITTQLNFERLFISSDLRYQFERVLAWAKESGRFEQPHVRARVLGARRARRAGADKVVIVRGASPPGTPLHASAFATPTADLAEAVAQ